MTTTVDELNRWMSAPREGEHLEFKEAKNQYDLTKLFRYCVALANEGGGKLILGVTDKPPRKVVGSSAFPNLAEIQSRILDKLRFRVSVEELPQPDGRVVIFHVPHRPVGTAYSFEGAYLMRSGEDTVSMTEDRLRAIFNEGKPGWLLEPARDGLSAADVIQSLDTQSYFDMLKLPYPATREAVLDRIEHERLVSKTRQGLAITNLGAALFAKRLDEFEGLARKAPRVIVYDGKSKLRTKREQTGSKGYAIAFDGLVQFVESQTPANEVIEQALRRDARMYPTIAIRELVANALIHQDFTQSGVSVMIEIYDDRIEVSNPGQPGVQPERFIDEYRSRNEQLADLMRRLGICEEKGSGIDKIVDAAEVFQLPAPEFRVDNVRTTCILYSHRPFSDMSRDDRVRACYQHCCLRYVMRETVGNQTLRKRFGLSDERAETVSRILRDTVDAGLIKQEDPESGSKKYARYVPFWA
ncbi:MAG: ATP-binding protein [Nitrospirota bacterium]